MTLAADSYAALPEFLRDEDTSGVVLDTITAACAPQERLLEVLSDPALWTDPARTPNGWINWLAALAGLDVEAVPQPQRRAVVADVDWRYRGTETAIRYRVGQTLTGAKSVEIVYTDWKTVSVTTYASQTPDATATTAAITAELPAWMAATIVTDAAGQSYSAMAADYPTYGDMETTNKSYGTLSQET